jgi:hypothetical protein
MDNQTGLLSTSFCEYRQRHQLRCNATEEDAFFAGAICVLQLFMGDESDQNVMRTLDRLFDETARHMTSHVF